MGEAKLLMKYFLRACFVGVVGQDGRKISMQLLMDLDPK